MSTHLSRGGIWLVDLDPVRGHEQGRVRPCLIVSSDLFNNGPSGLLVVAPLTIRERQIRLHVRIDPPEGGLRQASFVRIENVRSISVDRLLTHWGRASAGTMDTVDDRLRILLDL